LVLSSRKYDPRCSSRIRILIFYPSRIPYPGSKHHRVSDPDPQHWFEGCTMYSRLFVPQCWYSQNKAFKFLLLFFLFNLFSSSYRVSCWRQRTLTSASCVARM
jgi:hypothetical protein